MLEIFEYMLHGLQFLAGLYMLWLILWCINSVLKIVIDKRQVKLRNAKYVQLQAELELKLIKETHEQRQTES